VIKEFQKARGRARKDLHPLCELKIEKKRRYRLGGKSQILRKKQSKNGKGSYAQIQFNRLETRGGGGVPSSSSETTRKGDNKKENGAFEKKSLS